MDAVTISNNAGITSTIYAPPVDAVRIAAGADIQAVVDAHPAGTAFLLSEGTYTGQTIHPKDGNSFYGENGKAVLDGAGAEHAFEGQHVSDVTISGLKITNYAPPGQGIGALGTDGSSTDWIAQDSEFTGITSSTPIMLGTRMIVRDNYIHDNERAGIGAWDVTGAVVQHNEISNNNLSGASPFTATGSGAGVKITQATNTAIANNYIHDSTTSPGVWTDINCSGTTVQGNHIANNDGPGVLVELDYGATVKDNRIEGNNDPSLEGFQGGGIYIQNSSNAEVTGNTIRDNVGGFWIYESERGAGTQGPWVVSNVSLHDNVIQLSSGDNGMGGSVQPSDVNWSSNTYYLTGSAELIADGGAKSVSEWQATDLDTSASGTVFNSGSMPSDTTSATPDNMTSTTPDDVASTATAPVVQTIGSGADNLALKLSQDYYQGSAQYTVAVDGNQIGDVLTAGAIAGSSQDDVLTVKGDWGTGSHTVTVTFINDLAGASAEEDRNLHVEGISLNGTDLPNSTDVLYSNGAVNFDFNTDMLFV
jgi:parallel beta-helix repeat protein